MMVPLISKFRIVIPIHLGVHWTCCAVLMKKKKIIYLDSMGGNNYECMETILEYLKTEHKTRNMLKCIT